MTSGIHHVSCCTDDDSLRTFLEQVIGLSEYDRFVAPSHVTTAMFAWPTDNPGADGVRFGAGPNGLVEVVSIPPELRGVVAPGVNFLTYTVKNLDGSLERARTLGCTVGPVAAFDPRPDLRLRAAAVTAGGVTFELVRYERR